MNMIHRTYFTQTAREIFLKTLHCTQPAAVAGMLTPLSPASGLNCPKAVLYMNYPAGAALALTWKPAICACVKKDGPLRLLFRPHIPAFTLRLMKLRLMRLPFPLFCYTAAGWHDDKFYVPAVRIEQDVRQESAGYDDAKIKSGTEHLLEAYPHNRLVKHLMENCCLTYNCPAARNLSLARWECPIPYITGLQCQLYRLHFVSAAGRNHSLYTRQAYL